MKLPLDIPSYGAPNVFGGRAPFRLQMRVLLIAFMWRFQRRL